MISVIAVVETVNPFTVVVDVIDAVPIVPGAAVNVAENVPFVIGAGFGLTETEPIPEVIAASKLTFPDKTGWHKRVTVPLMVKVQGLVFSVIVILIFGIKHLNELMNKITITINIKKHNIITLKAHEQ